MTLTGLGLKMANGLIELAGGNLLLSLFFTMITSLILGMGAPTTANYVITSTMAAPALILLKVPLLAAHMFVFYFGIIADITPPVALAAYAGAGIAKSDPMKTGFIATKLAIGAFIVPYIFVYNPAMLLIGTTPLLLTQNLITASCGMFGVGAAMIGYCLAPMSWGLSGFCSAVAGLMLIDPGTITKTSSASSCWGRDCSIQWRKSRSLKKGGKALPESPPCPSCFLSANEGLFSPLSLSPPPPHP